MKGKLTEQFLSIEDALPLFKSLNYNSIDVVRLMLLWPPFFTKHSYVLGEEKEPIMLCTIIDAEDHEWIDETKISVYILYSNRKKKTIPIKTLRIKCSDELKEFIENLTTSQNEEQIALIKFVKVCCPLLNKTLKHRAIKTENNFRANKLEIKTAAILITTWKMLNERFALLNQKNTSELNDRKKDIAKIEQENYNINLQKLTKDFKSNPKHTIEIGGFIKWLIKNNNFIPPLNQDINKYYRNLIDIKNDLLLTSKKNQFIVKTLLYLIFRTLKLISRLNNALPNSIIETDKNQHDYTGDVTSYPEKIINFAENFKPISLNEIKYENKDNLYKFKQIIKLGLRWFIKINHVEINNPAENMNIYIQK